MICRSPYGRYAEVLLVEWVMVMNEVVGAWYAEEDVDGH